MTIVKQYWGLVAIMIWISRSDFLKCDRGMGSTAEKAEKKETEELQGGYSVYTDLLITTFFKCTHTDTLSHLYFLFILQWCVCVCVCRWSLAFIQIKEWGREWEMDWGMWGLVKMAWAEHCGCFLPANPCDWWLGSIKSLCWRPCQLLINPSKCLLHSGPERLLYVQQRKMHVHAHTRGMHMHIQLYTQKHMEESSLRFCFHWMWNETWGIYQHGCDGSFSSIMAVGHWLNSLVEEFWETQMLTRTTLIWTRNTSL